MRSRLQKKPPQNNTPLHLRVRLYGLFCSTWSTGCSLSSENWLVILSSQYVQKWHFLSKHWLGKCYLSTQDTARCVLLKLGLKSSCHGAHFILLLFALLHRSRSTPFGQLQKKQTSHVIRMYRIANAPYGKGKTLLKNAPLPGSWCLFFSSCSSHCLRPFCHPLKERNIL